MPGPSSARAAMESGAMLPPHGKHWSTLSSPEPRQGAAYPPGSNQRLSSTTGQNRCRDGFMSSTRVPIPPGLDLESGWSILKDQRSSGVFALVTTPTLLFLTTEAIFTLLQENG